MRWRGGIGAGTVDKQTGRQTAIVRLVLCAQAAARTHLDDHLYAVLVLVQCSKFLLSLLVSTHSIFIPSFYFSRFFTLLREQVYEVHIGEMVGG